MVSRKAYRRHPGSAVGCRLEAALCRGKLQRSQFQKRDFLIVNQPHLLTEENFLVGSVSLLPNRGPSQPHCVVSVLPGSGRKHRQEHLGQVQPL